MHPHSTFLPRTPPRETQSEGVPPVIDHIGDAIFAVDNDWRIVYLNHAAEALLNARAAGLNGKSLMEAAPMFLAPSLLTYYQQPKELRAPASFEVCWDGAALWLEMRFYPSQHGLSICGNNISARHAAESALRRSQQRLKNLFEQAADCIIITDNKMCIVGANRRACEELGYSHGEILQVSIGDIGSQFATSAPMLDSLRAGQRWLYDLDVRRKDGTSFPAEVNISRFDEDGNEFFQAIVRDLTVWKESQRKGLESEQRFRDVIEMTPAGYVFSDATGRLIDVNMAFCSLSGYAKEELVGHGLSMVFAFPLWENTAFMTSGSTAVHGVEAAVHHKDGHLVPVLFNASIKRDLAGHAVSLTGLMTDITERKQSERRLEQLATHDTLTGLPNRSLLHTQVQQMLTSAPRGAAVAIMFIDLDRFKEVNDSFGHGPGDQLLCEVAARLRRALRPTDVVARLGGDEFVIAAHCSNGKISAARIARKLLATFATPVDIGELDVLVSASLGISMFPDDADTKELLFQSADTAMYRAKATGHNSYCFFAAEMTATAKARMALEVSLRRALSRNEFELHYQPRIDLKTMSMAGMEALIRWNHPELGQVSPAEFIPIAEETGLIESIGQWVLEEACTTSRRLMNEFGVPLRVSVNVAAAQLKCHDFADRVRAALRQSGLPPQFLELELTESALIEDMDRTAEMLRELKKLGVKLAVDDFGTGYSGLAYLRRFPIDVLKLDRSFVPRQDEGISSFDFIRAFVDMAHALQLSVVAEGVETAEILEFLQNTSCDEVQGYFLAKPLSLDAFENYLATTLMLDRPPVLGRLER